MVPLDGSTFAEAALPTAFLLARRHASRLHFARVHQPPPPVVAGPGGDPLYDPALDRELDREGRRYLDVLLGRIGADDRARAVTAYLYGPVAECLSRYVGDQAIDLVVMTTHARGGVSRAWLGSVADAVVRRAAVPVLMLRSAEAFDEHARTAPRFGRILVPLDGSSTAAMVLEPAAALARSGDATLVLLRVVQPVPMASVPPMGFAGGAVVEDEAATHLLARQAKGDLETAARELAELGVTAVERHVIVEPGVGRAILDFANRHRVDLIAMTSHGRGASRLVIGSIADKLLRGSSLPILLRRPALQGADRPLVEPGEIEQQLAAIAGN
jgi:nucleotide-binding universal stress UspA family protein